MLVCGGGLEVSGREGEIHLPTRELHMSYDELPAAAEVESVVS